MKLTEINAVFLEVVKRLNKRGWHNGNCDIYPRELPQHPFGGHDDDPPIYSQPGPCSCGAEKLAERANLVLRATEPGQMDLPL